MEEVVRWRWGAELVPCRREELRVVVVGGCGSSGAFEEFRKRGNVRGWDGRGSGAV